MNMTEFLSEKTYVLLPTKSNPKVYLPLDTKSRTTRAFKLYNPFSGKAKALKSIAGFLCVNSQFLAKSVLPTEQGKSSLFLKYVEELLGKKILTSVYIATAKDKVVLQLQDGDGILGYLKYPISDIGKERLINERNALNLLAQINRVPGLILKNTYDDVPFIIVENVEGSIGHVSPSEFHGILKSFQKDVFFRLSEHPRILTLRSRLEKAGQEKFSALLTKIANLSNRKYKEVFEHGDFAPWNLIRTETDIIPFDFEYFEERGLEYLDELKYHFQEQHLLHGKKGMNLISSISTKTNIHEFDLIFRIFLIKEVCAKAESCESITFEESLLRLMNTSKSLH